MPKLKLDKLSGVQSIKNMMEHREKGQKDEKEPERKTENPLQTESAPVKIYEKEFVKVGSTIRSKYEKGDPPRLHKMFYAAIVKAMNGEDEAIVTLTPILEELNTNRTSSLRMLSCFEAYGYLEIRRAKNVKGKSLIFRVLQPM